MSTAEAKKKIESLLETVVREDLNKKVHVVDLSSRSLLKSNAIFGKTESSDYRKNWSEFIKVVRSITPMAKDFASAVKNTTYTVPQLLEENGRIFLITLNYDAARAHITKISGMIPDNPDFGQSFRSRDYEDIIRGRSLAKLKGRAFLRKNSKGKYTIQIVEKLPNSIYYGLVPVYGFGDVKEIKYYKSITDKEYTTTNDLAQFLNIEVEVPRDANNKKFAVVRQRRLSVLDLGHGEGWREETSSPGGIKLQSILNIGLGPEGKRIVEQYYREYTELHNVVYYKFKNTSTDKEASAIVLITVQKHLRNNAISIDEKAVLDKVRNNIMQIIADIPGSNTPKQDAVEIVTNALLEIISGKRRRIKKHQEVKGKAGISVKGKKPTGSKNIEVKKSVKTIGPAQLRTRTGQFYGLTALQSLIDSMLTEKIKQNMGDGSRQNILNLRSGRLAESVKVERLSQSREGMITAFYSYMKNPYATFSEGGRQEFPRSRDPKLLISKSIREIAAEKVANRLRAVAL